MSNPRVDACSGCGISWIRLNSEREFSFHQCSINHRTLLSSKLYRMFFVCLTRSMYFYGIGNDDSFGTYHCSLCMTWWRQTHSPDILQKPFLSSTASRPASEKCSTPSSSCTELPFALCKKSPSPRPKWRACAREGACLLQFLDSNLFGLESSDVSF